MKLKGKKTKVVKVKKVRARYRKGVVNLCKKPKVGLKKIKKVKI